MASVESTSFAPGTLAAMLRTSKSQRMSCSIVAMPSSVSLPTPKYGRRQCGYRLDVGGKCAGGEHDRKKR